jgi:hypothetical protein
MELFGEHLALGTGIFLILALLMALAFEFVNGFHDTANAVATVIYTHSLRPVVAVVWSGFCNLMGVLTSSGAVAFGIIAVIAGRTCSKRWIRGRFRDGLCAAYFRDYLECRHLVFGTAGIQLAYVGRLNYGRWTG